MGNLVNQVNAAFGSQIEFAENKVVQLSDELKIQQAKLAELLPKLATSEKEYRKARAAEASKYDSCNSITLKTDRVNRLNIDKKRKECFDQHLQMKTMANQLQATFQSLKNQKEQLEAIIATMTDSYNVANADLTNVRTAYNDALQKAQEQERITEAQNTQNQIDLGTATDTDFQTKKIEIEANKEIEKAKIESTAKTQASNTTTWIVGGVILLAVVVTIIVVITKK